MTRLTQEGRIDYNRKCEQWPLQWSAEKGKKFYYTPEWEKCRDEFLDGREKVCCKCGSTDTICVDQIIPLRIYHKYNFKSSFPQVAVLHHSPKYVFQGIC